MQMNPIGCSARMHARNALSGGGGLFGWLEGLHGYRRPWRKPKSSKRKTLRTHRIGR